MGWVLVTDPQWAGGAKVNGSTDDTAAWVAACAGAAARSVGTLVAHDNTGTIATRPTIFCPDGTSIITATIDLPPNVNVVLAGRATVRAGATIAGPMFRTPSATLSQDCTFQGGALDCASNAQTGLYFRYFAGLTVSDTTVIDATSHSVIFGDPGVTSSFGARTFNLQVRRSRGVSVPSGSYGYWARSCTDSDFHTAEIIGADTGVRNDGGSNRFHALHPWGYNGALPSVGFDDNAAGTYIGCYADSPSSLGWRLRVASAVLIGCKVFANSFVTDNTISGVQADASGWVSLAMAFVGGASNRIATAYSGTAAFSGIHLGDIQTNVASTSITNFGGTLTLGGGSLTLGNSVASLLNLRNSSGTQLVNVNTSNGYLELPNAAQFRGYSNNYTTETVRIDPATGMIQPGTTAGKGCSIFSGSGAPTIAGTAGDYYFRTGTPTNANQRVYVCTATGAAGSATWVGLVSPNQLYTNKSGAYVWSQYGTTTSVTLSNAVLRLAPMYFNAMTISAIGTEFTAAGDAASLYRMTIFADDGSGYPGALVLDGGSVSTGTSNSGTVSTGGTPGVYMNTGITATAVTDGLYWLGGAVQGVTVTQPTMRTAQWLPHFSISSTSVPTAGQGSLVYTQSSVTAAPPSNFQTFAANVSGLIPARIILRIQ